MNTETLRTKLLNLNLAVTVEECEEMIAEGLFGKGARILSCGLVEFADGIGGLQYWAVTY